MKKSLIIVGFILSCFSIGAIANPDINTIKQLGWGYIINKTDKQMSVWYRTCIDVPYLHGLCSPLKKVTLDPINKGQNYIKVKAEYYPQTIPPGYTSIFISVVSAKTSKASSNYGNTDCAVRGSFGSDPSISTILLGDEGATGKISCTAGNSAK